MPSGAVKVKTFLAVWIFGHVRIFVGNCLEVRTNVEKLRQLDFASGCV